MSLDNLKNRVVELGVALGKEITPANNEKQLKKQIADLEAELAQNDIQETDGEEDTSDQAQIGSGSKEPPAPEPTPEPTNSSDDASEQTQIGSGSKEPPAPEPTPEPESEALATIELKHSGLLVTSHKNVRYQLKPGVQQLPCTLAKTLAEKQFGVLHESAQ